MKKKILIFSLLALVAAVSAVIIAIPKGKLPTVDIALESTSNSISYQLSFGDVDSEERNYKIEISSVDSFVAEKVSPITNTTGEFTNLALNTEYKVKVLAAKNKNSTEFNEEIGAKSIKTKLGDFKDIKFESQSFVYDGTAKSIYISNKPEGASVTYIGNEIVDAGEHTVTATITKENYNPLTLTAKMVISKGDFVFEFANATKVYDGTPLSMEHPDGLYEVEYYLGETKLDSAPVNAGEYTAKAIFESDNYNTVTKTATLTITKADSLITVENKNIEANYGQTYSINAVVSNGDNAVITYNTTDGKAPVNAGTYTATVSYPGNDNYNAAEDVTVNIKINTIEETFTLDNKTVIYNGEAHELKSTSTLPLTYEYYLGTTKLDSAPVNAGTYKVKAIFAGDTNHEAKTVEATLVIEKASSTITASDLNVVYNGEAHSVVATVSNGDTPVITYDTTDGKAPIDAGTYNAVITYGGNENYSSASSIEVTIVIAKAQVSITANAVTATYDGSAHSIVATLSNGATPEIIYNTEDQSAPVNAGSYKAFISYAGDDNYEAATTIEVSILIDKADVSFEVVDKTYTYNGNSVDYTIDFDKTLTYTFYQGATLLEEAPKNAGTYKVIVEFAGDRNYRAYTDEANIVISKCATEITLEVPAIDVVYDGEAHPVNATVSNAAEPTITYNTVDGKAPVNAGVYTAVVSYAGDDNYEAAENKTCYILIGKAIEKIIVLGKNVVYNGSEHSVEAEPYSAGQLTYEYYLGSTKLDSAPVDAGTYTAKVNFAGNENYAAQEVEVRIVIEKADSEIIAEDTTVTYDGNSKTINVRVAHDNDATVTVIIKKDGQVVYPAVNACTYDFIISYSGDKNHNSATKTVNLIIEKADTTITASDINVEYEEEYTVNYSIVEVLKNTVTIEYYNLNNEEISKPTESGSYYAIISSVGNENYNSASKKINIVIKNPNYINTVIEADDLVVDYLDSYEIAFSIADAEGNNVEFTNDDVVITYNGSITKPSNAGVYEVKIQYKQNDELFLNGSFETITLTINKLETYVVITSEEVTYDGENHFVTATLYNAKNDEELDFFVNVVYTLNGTNVYGLKDAGSYKVVGSYLGSSNHEASSKEVTIEVSKAQSTITVDNPVINVNYGQTYNIIAVVSNYETPVITYNTADGKAPVNAGTYTAIVSYAGNGNYLAAESVEVSITINKVSVDFTFEMEDVEVLYDGLAHTITANYNYDVELLSYEIYFNGQLVEEAINAGAYNIKAIFAGDNNYEPSYREARLVIEYATLTATIYYNGLEFTGDSISVDYLEDFTITAKTSTGKDATVYYYLDGHPYASTTYGAGTYIVKVKHIEEHYHDYVSKDITLVVNKIQSDLSYIEFQEVDYTGSPFIFEFTSSIGVNVWYKLQNSEEDYTLEAPSNAGTYNVKLVLGNDSDYTDVEHYGTLTIKHVYLNTQVSLFNKTEVFDGNAKTLTISGTLETGLTVSYEYYQGEEKLDSAPINVGVYTVKAILHSDNPNHLDRVLTATLTITGGQVTATTGSLLVAYDGSEKPLSVTLSNGQNPTIVYYDSEDELLETAPIYPGTYKVVVTCAAYGDFTAFEAEYTYVVEKGTIDTEELTYEISVEFVENMTIQNIKTQLDNLNLSVEDYSVELVLGENTITVTISQEHYEDYSYELTITVFFEETFRVVDFGLQIKGRDFDRATVGLELTTADGTKFLEQDKYEVVVKEGHNTNGKFTVVVKHGEETFEGEITPIDKPELMIYAVYGGGGNGDATYKHDFVILYNNSNKEIDLTGFAIALYSAEGKDATVHTLSGKVAPYSFYKVQCASYNIENGAILPFETNESCNLAFAEKQFKVVLSSTSTKIDLSVDYSKTNIIDLLGVGSDKFEGEASAEKIDKNSFIIRKNFEDTDDNSKDFIKKTFDSNSFDFLKDGYRTYNEAKAYIDSQEIDFNAISTQTKLEVLTESFGKSITWIASGNSIAGELIDIDGNIITIKPKPGEIHSVLIEGRVEGTDFIIIITLNLSQFIKLPDFTLTINENDLTLEWAQVGAATSYEIYAGNTCVDTRDKTYDKNYYYLSNIKENTTLKVIAYGPEGYLSNEATIYYDYTGIMNARIEAALSKVENSFTEEYTIIENRDISIITNDNNVTISYECDSDYITINDDSITLIVPNETVNITINVTATIDSITKTNQVDFNLSSVTPTHYLTKLTNESELVDGTQIVIGSENYFMGEFSSTYYTGIDCYNNENIYLENENQLTHITLRKVVETGTWLLEVAEKQYLYVVASNKTEIKITQSSEANSQWDISFEDGNIIIANVFEPTRFIRYSVSNNKFAAYKNDNSVAAYIIKELITVNEISDEIETGSQIKPSIDKVYYKGEELSADNYTLTYGENVNPGKGTITITLKNGYSGTKTVEFNIIAEEPEGPSDPITVKVVIKDYAEANSWVNSTKYTTLNLDDNLVASVTGGSNTGKYYTDGNEWRTYQTESPTINISAINGKKILSVKISYNQSNGGTLVFNGNNIGKGVEVEIDSINVTFTIASTSGKTNAQVKITAIEVTYQ